MLISLKLEILSIQIRYIANQPLLITTTSLIFAREWELNTTGMCDSTPLECGALNVRLTSFHICASDQRQSLFTGLDHWTGLLDWNTGLTFDPKISYKRLHLATPL